MSKRAATNQMTHDNWDQEEEKEEAGVFKSLSEKELKNRVIKKAKRSLNTSDSSGSTGSPSPFSAFTGFSTKPSSQPNFSFTMQAAKPESQSATKQAPNGYSKSSEDGSKDPTSEGADETSSKKLCLSDSAKSSGQEVQDQSLQYFRMLRNLNDSVLKWMQLHFSKNPCCNFCPVFNDYKNYVQQLEIKYLNKSKTAGQPTTTTTTTAESSSSFKAPEKPDWMRSSPSRSDFFKAGGTANESQPQMSAKGPKSDSDMDYGASFSSNTTNTSTFSFGIKNSPTETSAGRQVSPAISSKESDKNGKDADTAKNSGQSSKNTPFTFGFQSGFSNQSASSEKSLFGSTERKPFTFHFTPSSSSASASADSEEMGEKEEYVPPKNDFTPVTEEDALYSKRCKLFFQKDNDYIDKGIGTLYLKPVNGKTQLLIRADTSLGNILLNIMLSSSLPMQRTGKNNVLIMCVPNPPLETKEKDAADDSSAKKDAKIAVPLLLRVKTSEDADELLEMLNKYKS